MAPDELHIEVVYALPERQLLLEVKVPAGTTARRAVELSGIQAQFPETDLSACPLGIFSREVNADHVLAEGDRVELYRPLVNDPREARRELAARGESMGGSAQSD